MAQQVTERRNYPDDTAMYVITGNDRYHAVHKHDRRPEGTAVIDATRDENCNFYQTGYTVQIDVQILTDLISNEHISRWKSTTANAFIGLLIKSNTYETAISNRRKERGGAGRCAPPLAKVAQTRNNVCLFVETLVNPASNLFVKLIKTINTILHAQYARV